MTSVILAAIAFLWAGCATNFNVSSQETYISEIEQELIPREVALNLVKQHFDIKNDSQLLLIREDLKYDRKMGQVQPVILESQWYAMDRCIIAFNVAHPSMGGVMKGRNSFNIYGKAPRSGAPYKCPARYRYFFTSASHRPLDIPHDALGGRHALPDGMTLDEISQLNRKLAAAFVALGVEPAPAGEYDLWEYVLISK